MNKSLKDIIPFPVAISFLPTLNFLRIASLLFLVIISCHSERYNEQLSDGVRLGKVDERLQEASGLVASINNPGFLWTINDSGNSAEVFLIDQSAKIRMVCKLANIKNRDWEDIGIDMEADGKPYLYVADIGDNSLQHPTKLLYHFEEPILNPEPQTVQEITVDNPDTFILRMPDGIHDAETLLIDPRNHDVYILSKRKDSVGIYLTPPLIAHDTLTLKKITALPLEEIVAGSFSRDGSQLLLRNYVTIFYWQRSATESLQHLLAKPYNELPHYHEQQGEAIAWSLNGTEFFTLSESNWREQASLIRYKKEVVK